MRNIKRLAGVSAAAVALAGFGGVAHADDDWALHGFGDVSVKNDYITPRGLVVTNKGTTVQILEGLVVVAPDGTAVHAGTWVDLNPGYDKTANKTVFNEFDWFVGIDKDILPGLNVGVEYSEFISGQPTFSFKNEHNLEFSVKYKDKGKALTLNPYAKLFWAFSSASSTVVSGKEGGTFDVELGAVPTYKTGGVSISMPTWITVGPESYWGSASNGLIKGGLIPLKNGSNFGVFSTGLKISAPIKPLKGARASVYGFGQYYHLINDNLVAAKNFVDGGTGTSRDYAVFGAGISFGF